MFECQPVSVVLAVVLNFDSVETESAHSNSEVCNPYWEFPENVERECLY